MILIWARLPPSHCNRCENKFQVCGIAIGQLDAIVKTGADAQGYSAFVADIVQFSEYKNNENTTEALKFHLIDSIQSGSPVDNRPT